MTDGLKDVHRIAIIDLLRANERVERAVLFGSRATETFTHGSDVDIALFGASLTTADQTYLAAAMEELAIPQMVDLLLYEGVEDAALREHVRRHGIELYKRQENASAIQLHLLPKHRQILEVLLREHLPDVEVWAYGSRVNGRSHDGSDLNLVLRAPDLKKIPNNQLRDFKEATQDSDLPFLVEACDWVWLPESHRREIKKGYVVLSEEEKQNIPDVWQDRILGECAILIRESVAPESLEDVPYIGLEHIGEGTLSLNGYGCSGDVTSIKSLFRSGDTLFGKLRPYFRKVVRAPFDGICSTDIWVIRAKEEIDQTFLYYSMASQAFVDYTTSASEGTRMPRAKWDYASQYILSLPPLAEQRTIAHILEALDDKIELNRRTNETLEAIARAIFKDWFVDFGPIYAKMEGREPYLTPEIWNLFPDAQDEDNKPVGWEMSEIGKEVKAVGGATPSTKEPSYWKEEKHHWATPKDLSKLVSPVLLDTDRKLSDTGLKKINSGLLPIGTVLLSSRAPIGYLAVAEVPTAINQGFIALVCEGRLPNIFVLFWCQENLDHIKGISGGSTFSEISKKMFRPIPVIVPPDNIIAAYDDIVRPLYNRIAVNTKESVALSQIRNFLLPKLISGEIRT